MGIADDAVEIRAAGLAHARRAARAHRGAISRRALQSEHELSVVEYTVLDALSRQDGWHMRMAATRARRRAVQQRDHPVGHPTRGPRTAHPHPLRRRPSRHLHRTHRGGRRRCSSEARPTHDAVLREALENAARVPELQDLVTAVAPRDEN